MKLGTYEKTGVRGRFLFQVGGTRKYLGRIAQQHQQPQRRKGEDQEKIKQRPSKAPRVGRGAGASLAGRAAVVRSSACVVTNGSAVMDGRRSVAV